MDMSLKWTPLKSNFVLKGLKIHNRWFLIQECIIRCVTFRRKRRLCYKKNYISFYSPSGSIKRFSFQIISLVLRPMFDNQLRRGTIQNFLSNQNELKTVKRRNTVWWSYKSAKAVTIQWLLLKLTQVAIFNKFVKTNFR